MGLATANPGGQGTREAADWQLNGQSLKHRVGAITKYTEQNRLSEDKKQENPDPAKSGVNKPPDARPLRASLPRIPTRLALSSAASAALSLRAHLPTAPPFGRALIATAGAPHSPSLA